MINYFKKKIFNFDTKDRLFFIVLTLFPLSLILGNLLINISIVLFSVSFFLNINDNKFFLRNRIFYILIFFFLSLLVNIFFSSIPVNSTPRVLKILIIIFFVIESLRIFNKYKFEFINDVFLLWSILFIIVLLDCAFEVYFGFNSLGFSTPLNGRIASFFGEELVVGAFIHAFALFFLSYLIYRNSNNYLLLISVLSIILISFLIGERSNFIKLFISIIIFVIIALKTNYLNKIISLIVVLGILTGVLNFNQNYKNRYYDALKQLYQKDGISNYLKKSHYGAHYNVAFEIFKEHPFFGVGIKNFRYESNKKKYENEDYQFNNARQATHPHQIHFEFLSETGLFGYVSFLIFILLSILFSIKSYIQNKNLYQLSGLIYILSILIPLLPSGSFLSTFNSSIFWINYAIMVGFCKILKSKS